MLKRIFISFCFVLLSISNIQALTFQLKDPCQLGKDFFKGELSFGNLEKKTVEEVTRIMIERNPILQGEMKGDLVLSFLNKPGIDSGDRSLCIAEEESPSKMRSFGWCYYLNNERTKSLDYGSKVFVSSQDTLTWYYCYAEMNDDIWIKINGMDYFPAELILKKGKFDWSYSWYQENICPR